MADNPRSDPIRRTPHERHMVELAFTAVALLVLIIAVGGYVYVGIHAHSPLPDRHRSLLRTVVRAVERAATDGAPDRRPTWSVPTDQGHLLPAQ